MLVHIEKNRIGHLEVDPVNEKTHRRLRRHYEAVYGKIPKKDSLLYIQRDDNVESFLENFPEAVRRDVLSGYPVRARLSEEIFCAYIGI